MQEPAVDTDLAIDDATSPPTRHPLRWWVEILLTLGFYIIYSGIRNQFGSALGDKVKNSAFDNAIVVIDVEKALGLYVEEWVQAQFIAWDWFVVFWNVFYGSFHFIVTIFAMVFMFARYPRRYAFMRSALCATTTVALVGFAFYPLMPPRLLSNCVSQYGACQPGHDYIDTLVHPGGLWSFESGTMETISNQYAAMPSLHVAWALWSTIALYPVLRSRWARLSIAAYPALTMFAIVVTANHYWIDAIGGVVALGAGLALARPLARLLPGPAGTLSLDAA